MTRAFELFNFAVSIVNPSMSFSVTATINGSAVVFLVDSGSALTILRKDTWEKCKESGQNLRPWNQKRLVGAEGSQLRVFGSAEVTVDIQGEKFQLSVVVIEPLVTEAILGLDLLSQCTVDLLHKQLITGVGHVVTLHCQQQNMKLTADLVDVYRIEADPGGSDATSFMCSNVESSQHIESPQQESNVKLFQQDSLTCHNQEVDDQSVKSSCVFSVKVQDNVRIPSYSEMEILACVNWCTQNLSSCYVLECNLRNSDLFVARALVKGGSSVFIRLLNPTGKPVTLYSGANVATLSEAVEIVDNHKSVNGINLDSGISVSTVSHDIGKELSALEDIFQELVENTSLSDNEKHGRPFSVGDLVMLYTSVVPRGYCKKLHRPWSGPFKILKKLSDVTYRIQRCQGRRQRLVVHFNRLKLCPSDIREESSSIAYGSRNDAFVSSAPARLHHLESGLNSETDLMLEDSSDDDDIDENVQGEDDDQLTDRAGDDSVGNDNQLTIASEQSRVLEPVVEEQETESATVSQQSSDEHLSTEVVDVPRRYPSRTHQPPTRYDNYIRW